MEGSSRRKQYIHWKDKYNHISASTWAIQDTNQRLERARKDLVSAGALTQEQANTLTVGQLNNAFTKLPEETKQHYLALRKGQKEGRVNGKMKFRRFLEVCPCFVCGLASIA